MVVGIRKYGLVWEVDVGRPWLVLHGGKRGSWVGVSRGDMEVLWARFGDVGKINGWLGDQLDGDYVCKLRGRVLFSTLEV